MNKEMSDRLGALVSALGMLDAMAVRAVVLDLVQAGESIESPDDLPDDLKQLLLDYEGSLP